MSKDVREWCAILIGQTRVKKYELLRGCQKCGHHVPILGTSISEPDRLFHTDNFAFGKMSELVVRKKFSDELQKWLYALHNEACKG
jgi:hypothetical protein